MSYYSGSGTGMAGPESKIIKSIVLLFYCALSIGSNYILYKYTGPDYNNTQFENTVNETERSFLLWCFFGGLIMVVMKLADWGFSFWRFTQTGMMGGGGYGYDSYGSSGMGSGYTDMLTKMLDLFILVLSASSMVSSAAILGFKYYYDIDDLTWSIVSDKWRTYAFSMLIISGIVPLIGIASIIVYMKKQTTDDQSAQSVQSSQMM